MFSDGPAAAQFDSHQPAIYSFDGRDVINDPSWSVTVITYSVTGVSRPPVLDFGTAFHLDYGGRDLRYDTIRDAILTCARKPTRVSLIYRTEPTTRKCKTKKTKKLKRICSEKKQLKTVLPHTVDFSSLSKSKRSLSRVDLSAFLRYA